MAPRRGKKNKKNSKSQSNIQATSGPVDNTQANNGRIVDANVSDKMTYQKSQVEQPGVDLPKARQQLKANPELPPAAGEWIQSQHPQIEREPTPFRMSYRDAAAQNAFTNAKRAPTPLAAGLKAPLQLQAPPGQQSPPGLESPYMQPASNPGFHNPEKPNYHVHPTTTSSDNAWPHLRDTGGRSRAPTVNSQGGLELVHPKPVSQKNSVQSLEKAAMGLNFGYPKDSDLVGDHVARMYHAIDPTGSYNDTDPHQVQVSPSEVTIATPIEKAKQKDPYLYAKSFDCFPVARDIIRKPVSYDYTQKAMAMARRESLRSIDEEYDGDNEVDNDMTTLTAPPQANFHVSPVDNENNATSAMVRKHFSDSSISGPPAPPYVLNASANEMHQMIPEGQFVQPSNLNRPGDMPPPINHLNMQRNASHDLKGRQNDIPSGSKSAKQFSRRQWINENCNELPVQHGPMNHPTYSISNRAAPTIRLLNRRAQEPRTRAEDPKARAQKQRPRNKGSKGGFGGMYPVSTLKQNSFEQGRANNTQMTPSRFESPRRFQPQQSPSHYASTGQLVNQSPHQFSSNARDQRSTRNAPAPVFSQPHTQPLANFTAPSYQQQQPSPAADHAGSRQSQQQQAARMPGKMAMRDHTHSDQSLAIPVNPGGFLSHRDSSETIQQSNYAKATNVERTGTDIVYEHLDVNTPNDDVQYITVGDFVSSVRVMNVPADWQQDVWELDIRSTFRVIEVYENGWAHAQSCERGDKSDLKFLLLAATTLSTNFPEWIRNQHAAKVTRAMLTINFLSYVAPSTSLERAPLVVDSSGSSNPSREATPTQSTYTATSYANTASSRSRSRPVTADTKYSDETSRGPQNFRR